MDFDYVVIELRDTLLACYEGTDEIPAWARITILGIPILACIWFYLERRLYLEDRKPSYSMSKLMSQLGLLISDPQFMREIGITLGLALFFGVLFWINPTPWRQIDSVDPMAT